jgi:monofunctional glycosyltransferase
LLRKALLGLLLAALGGAIVFDATLPDVRPLKTSFPRTTSFMERRKRELQRQGEKPVLEWIPVPLSKISPSLRRAAVVAEDGRFYEHGGVDWEAVRSSLEKDLERRRLKTGGSTITQQLAKNLYLSPARTPWRKLREWAIARRLERSLSKDRILELYLNVIEFGRRTYGAEAAARRYFGKSAAALSPMEAATLAAVIPSPRIYDPTRHATRVARRARRILGWMRVAEKTAPLAGSGPDRQGLPLPGPDRTPTASFED